MKYIKTYEVLNKPQVGDYILVDHHWPDGHLYKSEDMNYFINTHIGKIYNIQGLYEPKRIKVWYDSQPEEFDNDEYFLGWFKYRTIKGKKKYFYEFDHNYTIKLFNKRITPKFYEKIEQYKIKKESEKYNL